MIASNTAYTMIKKWEGLSKTAYKCPVGILTIGYGHVIRANEKFPRELTEEQCDKLLVDDVAIIDKALRSYTPAGTVSQNQYDAIVSFCFNVGVASFISSTFYKKILTKDKRAGDELLRWVYGTIEGKKVKFDGLVRRRGYERMVFNGF